MSLNDDPVEIVSLPPEHWQAYRAIRLEALRDSPQAFGTTYADMLAKPQGFWQLRLEDAASAKSSWLLFARRAGSVLGMIGAFADPPESRAAAVISVFVTPAERGQGVSRLLMHAILERLAQAGFTQAHLSVNIEQKAALRLYQNFGFRVTASETNPMGDGQVHEEYLMERPLAWPLA